MSGNLFQVCECTDELCQFRFPLVRPLDGQFDGRQPCPLCGHTTIVASERTHQPDEGVALNIPASSTQPHIEGVLDNIRSLYNVGSLFRTADGAGFQALHLCGITPTPDNPKLRKTALGAESFVAWHYHRNALHAAHALLEQGYVLWALEQTPTAVSLFDCAMLLNHPQEKIALIVGNEVTGVDPDLLDLCSQSLFIPMRGGKQSLNVATAFGIAAYVLIEELKGSQDVLAYHAPRKINH
ncbi:MAG: RNA methyltransferase [Chloroflexota bacterium]